MGSVALTGVAGFNVSDLLSVGRVDTFIAQVRRLIPRRSIDQQPFGQYHRATLKANRCPGVIAQVLNLQHGRVGPSGRPREQPFKVSEEGRIVKRPFRSGLVVPLPRGERMGQGQPVAMYFKVGRLAFMAKRRSAKRFFRILHHRSGRLRTKLESVAI
jgi:hypothetical protein